MVKLLFKKMILDIRRSLSSYLVATIVLAVGFAGYTVISNAAIQLEESKQYFFQQTGYCDGFAEIKQAPLSAVQSLEKLDGITGIEGRLVMNVRAIGLEQSSELKLVSFQQEGMNRPMLMQGMMPQKGEIVLGNAFATQNNLSPGDVITLSYGGREKVFTISGTGLSPENIYLVKSINEMLPTPNTYDIGFLNDDDLGALVGMTGQVNNLMFTMEPGVDFQLMKETLEEKLMPYGCFSLYESKDELSVSVLQMEIEQIGKVGRVIPFMFLGIAAIILTITLHRLIEQQRIQIGTLMAQGVAFETIFLHYASYGGLVGFAGGLGGGLYGSLGAKPMANFYRIYFSLPEVNVPIDWRYLMIGVSMSTLFCLLVSGYSIKNAISLQPAEALRPAPPAKARRFPLERFGLFVKNMTLAGLMGCRSIARNPKRSLLSSSGIAFAYMITAILVSMNTMFDVFLFDYLEKNQRQDISIGFTAPVQAVDLYGIMNDREIERAEGILEIPIKIRGQKDELDGVLRGISPDAELTRLYDIADRRIRPFDEGIVLSTHMASRLGIKAGDWVSVELSYPTKTTHQLQVTHLMSEYLGSNAYSSLAQIGAISPYDGVYSSVLLKAPVGVQERLIEELGQAKQVATIQSRTQRVEQYREIMVLFSYMMGMLALMGMLIGLAVIYVGSLVNFEDLKREIAVLRTLGVEDSEALQAVSLGQWILFSIGVIAGLPLTVVMDKFISTTMSLELFSIPSFVNIPSLIGSILLLVVAVATSNRIILRKIRKSTPVELLRERE